MSQKSLFESTSHEGHTTFKTPPTTSRRTHSKTARDAAARLDSSNQKHRHMIVTQAIVFRFPGMTAAEIDEQAVDQWGMERGQARKRLADVQNHMKSIFGDENRKRPCKVKPGSPCKTWWPVEVRPDA